MAAGMYNIFPGKSPPGRNTTGLPGGLLSGKQAEGGGEKIGEWTDYNFHIILRRKGFARVL